MVYFSVEEMASVLFQRRDKWKSVMGHTGVILVGYRVALPNLLNAPSTREDHTADAPVLFVASHCMVIGHHRHR